MKEEKKELRTQHRSLQEKYTYYVIALCVSAVGFSIHQTKGLPLEISQIPLGFSIIFWSISVYCGIKFLRYQISLIYTNFSMLEIQSGNDPITGKDQNKIDYGLKLVDKIFYKDSNTASLLSKFQYYFFLIGYVFYIVWHVYEMFLLTQNKSV